MAENKLTKNPHQTLVLGLAVVIIFSLLLDCKEIDIQMHDTYYVTAPLHLALFFVMPLIIMAMIYWWFSSTKKPLTNWMTMGHIAFSLFSILTLLFILCENQANLTGNPYDVATYCLWAFAVGQILFFVNVGMAFFRK